MTYLLAPVASGAPLRNVVHHVDLLTLCDALPPQSVDMVLADLPYGTTACSWDEVIPFAPMWAAFKRIIKPRGAIVLTASQPFTSRLICSNLKMFRYSWVWNKVIGTGFLDANRKPLKSHEDICVFGAEAPVYYPQMTAGEPYNRPRRKMSPVYGKFVELPGSNPTGQRYPLSVLQFSNADRTDTVHPTQKPIALFEYLIRTYTRPGELVLDPTCGSGTTAIAARNTGRDFICGDTSLEYVTIARERLAAPYTMPLPLDAPPPAPQPVQTPLFTEATGR